MGEEEEEEEEGLNYILSLSIYLGDNTKNITN